MTLQTLTTAPETLATAPEALATAPEALATAPEALASRGAPATAGTGAVTAPDLAVRLTGALLALGVSTVHVADQGGITAFNSPDWIGWSYRMIEAGGVLTAIALLATFLPWSAWTGWAAGLLLGLGPFTAYLASRSIGIPGDPGDVGNWGYWVGTVSLFIEAALAVLCASMLLARRKRGPAPPVRA